MIQMNYNQLKIILIGIIFSLILINPVNAGANVTLNLRHDWASDNWLSLLISPLATSTNGLIYPILMFIVIGVIYIKVHHTIAIAIATILIGGTMISLIPVEFQGIAAVLLALSVAVIVWRMFYRND